MKNLVQLVALGICCTLVYGKFYGGSGGHYAVNPGKGYKGGSPGIMAPRIRYPGSGYYPGPYPFPNGNRGPISLFLKSKLSSPSFNDWYKTIPSEKYEKPDLDSIPVGNVSYFSSHNGDMMTLDTEFKDMKLLKIGSNLHPMYIASTAFANMITIAYTAENVSLVGTFAGNGTLFNDSLSFSGEGKFEIQLQYQCNLVAQYEYNVRENGDIFLKLGADDEESQNGHHNYGSFVSKVTNSQFTGLFKKTNPEIPKDKLAGVSVFISNYLGGALSQMPFSIDVMEALTPYLKKQLDQAIKDTSIFEIYNSWKDQKRPETEKTSSYDPYI